MPIRYCPICNLAFSRKSNYDYHVNHVAKNNKCVMKTDEMMKYHMEVMKQQSEMIDLVKTIITDKNINNTVNNGSMINTHNNTTISMNSVGPITNNNIQFVVSNYPNARNIEDCINVSNINNELFNKCKELSFHDGLKYIIKELCDIGEEHRPLHCTDANRDNYLVKTNDEWSIDAKASTIRSHLIPVANDTYKEVYKQKMAESRNDLDAFKVVSDSMSVNMRDKQMDKVCKLALRDNASSFLLKNNKFKSDEILDDEKTIEPIIKKRGRPKKS